MTAKTDDMFDGFAESIKAAAKEIHAHLVTSVISYSDNGSFPTVTLRISDTMEILRHARPRFVYLVEQDFDIDTEMVDDGADYEDENTSDATERRELTPRLERLASKWRKREGQQCIVLVGFVSEGVVHKVHATPAWYDTFGNELDAIREEEQQAAMSEEHALRESVAQEALEKAAKLADHPAFAAKQTSFDKRLHLAGHLFPNADRELLLAITNHADKIQWLRKAMPSS